MAPALLSVFYNPDLIHHQTHMPHVVCVSPTVCISVQVVVGLMCDSKLLSGEQQSCHHNENVLSDAQSAS
jgi:hypothetical protein